jgi:Fe2+ transport system protein FeoA
VTAVLGEGDIPLRLLEMGFLPDVEVSVIRRAPLGDPLEVEVLGYRLVLRLSEARLIHLRPASEAT